MTNQQPDIPEEIALQIIGQPYYQQRVLDAWKFIKLDDPVKLRQGWMTENVRTGEHFWNIHVALAFLSHRICPAKYLEIGVRTGGSMSQVLVNSSVQQVVGIDIWSGQYSDMPNTQEFTAGQIQGSYHA